MKAFPLVLTVSLALNALCLGLALRRGASSPTSATPAAATAATPAAHAPAFDAQTWAALQQDDPKAYLAQLRAAGFPPEIIRALLAVSLREASAARRKELEGDADLAFWKNPRPKSEVNAALLQLDREQSKLVRDLLPSPAETIDPLERAAQGLRHNLDFLPAAKSADVQRLIREYEERRNEIYVGYNYTADREKITALEKQLRDNIAQVLSSAELFEYDLRTSPVSNTLREELAFFNPTKAEFRTIFALRKPFDEQFNPRDFIASMTSDLQRPEAERVLREQLALQLGADRSAEYTRAIDSNYRRTQQLMTRMELPLSTADQLYALQKEYEQRRSDLYRNGPVNRDQLVEQATAWQQEASGRVTQLLGGTRGLDAYKQYGGTWIANMVPRPPITSPRTPTPVSR